LVYNSTCLTLHAKKLNEIEQNQTSDVLLDVEAETTLKKRGESENP
jgi:hypothetical protein